MGNLSHVYFFSRKDDHDDEKDTLKANGTMANSSSAELPKTYKAAVYDKPGSISTKVTELETPEPGPGEVLIKL
jgi:hypothetical protein